MPRRSLVFLSQVSLVLLWAFLIWNRLGWPDHLVFDEAHYVRAARVYLSQASWINVEHPPLAKIGIALGMLCLRDQPIAWRLMSALTGILFLPGIFRLARALRFSDLQTLSAGMLCVFAGPFLVLSRTAMLDMPMLCFLVWGIALWLESLSLVFQSTKRSWQYLLGHSLLGFSAAAKWTGGLAWLSALIAEWGIQILLRRSRTKILETTAPGIVAFLVSYFTAFLPIFGVPGGWRSFSEWVELQKQMWSLQSQVTQPHSYMSQWMQWFLPTRPIWFEYQTIRSSNPLEAQAYGILVTHTPMITLLGVLGLGSAAYFAVRKRDFTAFWLLYFYLSLYVGFAIIPRMTSFYYYYAPALIFLCLLIARAPQVFQTQRARTFFTAMGLLLCAVFFLYFFPLFSAKALPVREIERYIWFRSWV